MKRVWIALAVLGTIAGPARAADVFEKVGTFDGQFLKIGIGARASGMGGAFVAVADDPSAVFWNPAGLARLDTDKTSVMVNHIEWPASVNVDQATLVLVGSLMFVERHRLLAPSQSVLFPMGSIAIGAMNRIFGVGLLKLQLASVSPVQMYWLAFAGGVAASPCV